MSTALQRLLEHNSCVVGVDLSPCLVASHCIVRREGSIQASDGTHLLAECSPLEVEGCGLVAVALDSMMGKWYVGGVDHILCQSIKPAGVSSSSSGVVEGVEPNNNSMVLTAGRDCSWN
jgi:hypothetical protein